MLALAIVMAASPLIVLALWIYGETLVIEEQTRQLEESNRRNRLV